MNDEKLCPDCDSMIKVRAEICPKCGVRQFASPNVTRSFAIILALSLGGTGLHKLYLSQILWGIFYAFFFCIGLLYNNLELIALLHTLGVIEGFYLLFINDARFVQVYGSDPSNQPKNPSIFASKKRRAKRDVARKSREEKSDPTTT